MNGSVLRKKPAGRVDFEFDEFLASCTIHKATRTTEQILANPTGRSVEIPSIATDLFQRQPEPKSAPTSHHNDPQAPTSPPASPVLEGRDSPDLPLTMTASTMLLSLPRDATAALAAAGAFPQEKVVVRFKPVGSAPPLRRELVKVLSAQKFETVVGYLRRTLKVQDTESVFLYVNNTFAPALDEVVGNLWRCFKDSSDQLNISYSMTPAFG